MGQRTFYLVKKNFSDGRSEIKAFHSQWGYGKIMPMTFMEEFIRAYGYSPKQESDFTIKDYFNFSIYPQDIETAESMEISNTDDVFDINIVQKVADHFDNNNGCMIIEVSEKEMFFNHKYMSDAKIGFCFGDEEVGDEAFKKIVNARAYMSKFKNDSNLKGSMIDAIVNMFIQFDIKEA